MTSLSLLQSATATTIPAGAYQGRVARLSPLTVTLDAFDARHEWEPCTLVAGAEGLAVGDRVLVVHADDATFWVAAATAYPAGLVSHHLADIYANRPAASAALNGVRFFAIDKQMEWQCIAGAWVLVSVLEPESATIPASPIDGQRFTYVAAAGVRWVFEYNAATGYWDRIGASPLRNVVDTEETRANTAYGDLTTVGPQLTVPFAGDYDIEIGSRQIADAAAAFEGWMSYTVGATAASDADACSTVSSGQYDGGTVSMRRRKTGIAAGTAVVCKYRTQVASLYHWSKRYIEITPVRIG